MEKTTYNYNATELLKILVNERNWYQGIISSQLAAAYKKSIINGTIKYSTAVELLQMLGYKLQQHEVWVK